VTVYVDDARQPYRRMLMSHMFADTPAELHAMAARVGVARRWYQTPGGRNPASFPHYDVCQEMRAKAIAAGAVPVDRRTGHKFRSVVRDKIIADAEFAASWRDA
jgi:hypothetical protein